jgi:DNA-binding MarR family transcriptional regulator
VDRPQAECLPRIETEMAVLARSLELLRRRGRIHPDLDRAGYLLLRTLDETGPLSIHSLAERVGLDGSTVTRQVATLLRGGLAERRVDPGDRRSCQVTPSDRGRRLMGEVQRRRTERFQELLTGWTEQERADLGRILAKLNRSISATVLPAAAEPTEPTLTPGGPASTIGDIGGQQSNPTVRRVDTVRP